MRTRCRVSFLSLAIFAFAALPMAPTAKGASVSGGFEGTFVANYDPGNVPSYIAAPNNGLSGNFGYSTSDFTRSGSVSAGYTYTLTSYTPGVDLLTFTVGVGQSWNDKYVNTGAGVFYKITLQEVTVGSQTETAMTMHSSTATGGDLQYTLYSTSYTNIAALPTAPSAVLSFQNSNTVSTYLTPGDGPWGVGQNGDPGLPVTGTGFLTSEAAVVPEPSSIALAFISFGTVTAGFVVSRRKKHVA